MHLSDVFQEIIDELPWVDDHRLLVGALASRESVKDALLEQAPAIPAWAVCTLTEFAAELLAKAGVTFDKPLSAASQCDALERIAQAPFLREAVPEFCGHLRSRQVAKKVARFLSHLDRFYSNPSELAAVVEYFEGKDRGLGAFLGVVARLWEQGELSPWGEGCTLRLALENMDGVRLPKTITLWGFAEFTPLEEVLLDRLVQAGVRVRLMAPEALREQLVAKCETARFEFVALPGEAGVALESWKPHSAWDELEFLRDALAELRAQGVPWREIAVYVPNDDLYKRFARQKLHEWNVPLQDPTLSGGWKDQPRWLWWRDMLRTISSGLKLEDVRAWLGPGASRRELLEAAFERGLHGGAGQWAKLLEKHEVPEIRTLVEGMRAFSRAMTPPQFLKAAETFVPRVEQLLGGDGLETPLLLEFARHVCEERPYLSEFRSRLPRYVSLFEEFLEIKSRTQSVRSQDGIKFVGHGVWLPVRPRHGFVLGANLISRAKPGADVWDWEGAEVRAAWEKLHFGMPWAERVLRDEKLVEYSLGASGCVRFSGLEYDLSGKPLSKGILFERLCGKLEPRVRGGHEAVGWSLTGADELTPKVSLLRPDLVTDKPLSVSAFEDYLKCPFLYYARHVLELEREEDLGLDPNGRARGILMHRVLGRLVEEEMQGKLVLTRETGAKRLAEMIDEEVQKELRAGRTLSGMYRHKPLIDATVALIRSHTLKWLDWELENRKKFPALKPFAVEAPVELELAAGVRLRGRADRVDSDGKHAVVIDYKTGGAPYTGGELAEGLAAQLLVYAKGMNEKHGLEPAAAYYIGVGRKIEATKGVFLKKHQKTLHETNARNTGLYDGEWGTLFERVSENWLRAAQSFKRGDFAPLPARPKKDCDACHYKGVCGHQFDVPGPNNGGGGE